MAGNKLGFKYNTDLDLIDLADVVVDRVLQALEKYSLDSDQVVYIQLLFRKKKYQYSYVLEWWK